MYRTFIIIVLWAFLTPGYIHAFDESSARSFTAGGGSMIVGSNPYDLHSTKPINGSINIFVKDTGNRWSHLQNADEINITAEFTSEKSHYKININKIMPRHPFGKYTTFFGVAYQEEINGNTLIGTNLLPKVKPDIAAWGWAEVIQDDKVIGKMVPIHVKVMRSPPLKGIMLEVDTENKTLSEVPNGYLHVVWNKIDSLTLPENQDKQRERIGWLLLLILNIGFLWLAAKEL